MSDQVIIAIISGSTSMLTAIVALMLNHRGFGLLERQLGARIDSIERRLDRIEADYKEFFRILSEHERRLSRLEGR
jgi:hypothetical protein